MALVGVGLGLSFATAASAAVSELPEERSGVGAAVMQALQKVGAPFGAAILGSVLSSAYLADVHLSGLPAAATRVVRQSIFGGVVIARRIDSATLLHSVRAAFVGGMDLALLVSAGVALAGAILAIIFLPRGRAASKRGQRRASTETPVLATR